MPVKIAVIGAGSLTFTRTLVADILSVPELRDTCFSFSDISRQYLDMAYRLIKRDIEANGAAASLSATLNRREALRDAHYVLCVVRVGGLEAFKKDIEIPLKYGVDQCVGDTLGPGGIMYAQRGIPQLLSFCKDIAEVAAPGCLFITYANPMAMNTWACNKAGHGVRIVGLCHGVQSGACMIRTALGIKEEDFDYTCVGINHQTWYTKVLDKGRNVTHKILPAFEKHARFSKEEKVRIDMIKRFGYFSTESNGHLSEYLPWYRKRPKEIDRWIDYSSWINGETGGYLRVCTESRNDFLNNFPKWMKKEPRKYVAEKRSSEHASWIIESLETGRVYRGHFNVPNHGCIGNLPGDCIIEAPGYVDRSGISTPRYGDLPLGCAAVCNASVSVQRMAVEAALSGDDMLLRQSMLMDPLTGTVCNTEEVWEMADDMLVAEAPWLPQYKRAIALAKKRIARRKRRAPRRKKGR
jgi:alpha-galactosidase